MTDDRHPFLTFYCGRCGHPHRVELSCGDRTCPKCRKKWFGYHYKALLKCIELWPAVHLLTLTLKNVREIGRYDVVHLRESFTKLRKKFPEIHGGFYVVQATNGGKGWHLHLHVLFDGSFIAKERLSRAWADITHGSYIIDIKVVKDPHKAVRYLLADFSGAPRIRPEDYDEYNSVFAGSRLVQPFGKYRLTKLSSHEPFPCPICGFECWLFLDNLFDRDLRPHRPENSS